MIHRVTIDSAAAAVLRAISDSINELAGRRAGIEEAQRVLEQQFQKKAAAAARQALLPGGQPFEVDTEAGEIIYEVADEAKESSDAQDS